MCKKKIAIKLFTVTAALSMALSGCSQNVSVNSTDTAVDISEKQELDKPNENTGDDTTSEKISEETDDKLASSETEKIEFDLTETQHNSINMLNHLTVLTQEINSSKNSKLYLEQAYSSIRNNYHPNAIDDRTLGELNSLLDTLENYRMVAVKRERLNYIYEQNQAQALRDAVPNPLGLLSTVQSFNLASLVTSVTYMAVDSVTSYQTSSAQADLEYLQDGWALDDEEAAILHNQRKSAFNYMVKTVNENQLPGELALTEDAVDTFVEWKNNENVVSRIRFLEQNENTYRAYGGYWLTLAESYYENKDYEKCLSAIKSYEDLGICIFRKNYDYAATLPLAIASAEEVLGKEEYISAAERFAENIVANTENEQWSLRYFAAQTYVDLYGESQDSAYLQVAYDIVLNNVNNLVSEQRSMNDKFLAEIVKIKDEKGASSEKKDEIKQYNKMLKEDRKTELAPVYEPLTLNCDLLFSLVEELNISESDKQEISTILHQNEEPLFLIEELDNLYRFTDDTLDESKIDISFDGETLVIPVKYVSDNAKITVTVKGKNKTETIDDWKVDEVTRKKEKKLDTFQAVYKSKTAEDLKYKDKMDITIRISVKPDSDAQVLNFKYKTSLKECWSIIPDKLTFKRNLK